MADLREYFALTEEEALAKYEKYKGEDPFPEIFPALLSSTYIQAYIAKTGLIFPYTPTDDPKKERVTSASLTLTIGPEVLYWNSKNKRRYFNKLDDGAEIILRPNSITFLRPAERFNIPDYIAARFNLRIVHVHRGLLLGTGPLLDPGFKGYPMIPVHNLTENEYVIHVGDEFINVEFTKIANVNKEEGLEQSEYSNLFKYKKNRGNTLDFDFTKYVNKNVPQRKVKSSLSAVLDEARAGMQRQKEIAWATIAATALAVVALVYGGYQITIAATGIISDARYSINQYQQQDVKLRELEGTVRHLKKEIQVLQKKKYTDEKTILSDRSEEQDLTLEEEIIKGQEGKKPIKKD